MSHTVIDIKNSGGVILDTSHKYCDKQIQINPVLQTKSVTKNGSVVADDGYCGLSAVEINVPTGVDISDTTAIASDVRKGKTFYSSNGTKTQGTIENYGGASLSMSMAVLSMDQYGMSAAAIEDKIYLHGQNTNFELFDTKTNEYSLLDAVTNSITYFAPIATIDKKIYLFGGMRGYQQIAVLDTETDVIDVKSPGYTWESRCSGASVGNKIYLFGGDALKTGTTINVYNVTNNTFSKSNVALPISASGIAACAINDKIYLFGGHNRDTSTSTYGTFLDSINVFDVTNNTISTLDAKLPVGMQNIGVAAIGTKIYLFGGMSTNYEYHNTIYEFDTLTNSIKKIDVELPEGMHAIAAATANDKIYLFGGQSSSGLKNFIQIFSPKTSVLITTKDGETLPTNSKYCVDDIVVQPALEIKTITSNGEVTPSENYCGFEKVVVDVSTGIDISDTTAVAADVRQNKDFYLADGVRTTGTISDYDGSIMGNADQVGLNIYYGDTAPEDTSKLWVNAQTAKSVEISPDLYGETIQNPYTFNSGLSSTGTSWQEGRSFYWFDNGTVKRVDLETKEVETVYTGYSGSQGYIKNGRLYVIYGSKFGYYNLSDSTKTLNVIAEDGYYGDQMSSGTLQLCGDYVCVFGGGYRYDPNWTVVAPYGKGYCTSRVIVYQISTDTKVNSTMYSSCTSPVVCSIGDQFYIFGGYYSHDRNSGYLTYISKFNPKDKTSSKVADMPVGTSTQGVSVVGNVVYLFGGSQTSDKIYKFDSTTNVVTELGITLSPTKSSPEIAFYNNIFYIFPGTVSTVQLEVPLKENKLHLVNNAVLTNRCTIFKSSNAKIEVGVTSAFRGDENNKAKEVTAYVHDGINWHSLSGEIRLIKLYAPQISISGKTVTITNDGRNSSFVTGYKIYANNALLTTITDTSLDLTTVLTENGLYSISVVAAGTGYTDSNASNTITCNYIVYDVSFDLKYVNSNADNPAKISNLGSTTFKFTAEAGYSLPSNITVEGADLNWTQSSGTLVLSNPVSNVKISIEGEALSYSITPTLSYVDAAADNATSIKTGETKTLTYTTQEGYELPDAVEVSGAVGSWNKAEGSLTISNPTAKVIFTINGVAKSYTITSVLSQVTEAEGDATSITYGGTATLTYTAKDGYELPEEVTVTGATINSWTKSTGVLVIENPTENVTITVTGVAIAYKITTNLTNMTADSSNATTIKAGESVTLGFTPTGDHIYPYSVTVTGAESQYNSQNGYVYLKNATSDVTVTLNATEVGILGNSKITFNDKPAKPSSNVSFYANGTTVQMVDDSYSDYYITQISMDTSGLLSYSISKVAEYLGVGGIVYSVTGVEDTNTGKTYDAYEWIVPAAKELKVLYGSLALDQSDLNWLKANAIITKL